MDALERGIDKPKGCCKCFGVRHFQILLQMLFYVIIFGTQLAFPITINYILDSHQKSAIRMDKISLAMSSYFYSYLAGLLFGGWFCKKFGLKWPMVLLMVIIATVTINFPLLTKQYGTHGIMFCRIVQGICAGLLFPFPAEVISRWVPIQERTVLGTAVYASNILGLGVCGVLGPYLSMKFGWSFIFTSYGFIAALWAILMAIFGADSPEEYTRGISDTELNYIVQNRGGARPTSKVKIPWMRILQSPPFWAIVVAQIGVSWMIHTVAISAGISAESPSMLILLISWASSFVISGIAELLIYQGKTTIEQSRKIFNSIGCLIPAFLFLLWIFIPHGPLVDIVIECSVSVVSVATISGSKLNVNDITSNFAPVVYGLATLLGMIFITVAQTVYFIFSYGNWNVLLLFSVVVLLITNTFYLMYGSGQEQNWDGYDEIDERVEFSKSSSHSKKEEDQYLLFGRKQ